MTLPALNVFRRFVAQVVILSMPLAFSACTRSPVVEYYVLSPKAAASRPQLQRVNTGIMALATPSVPSYLDRDEIVERLSDNAVRIHEHQRWASDLDTMIRDYLIAALQERVVGISFVSHATKLARRANLRWEGVFTRLNINHGEDIELALSWHLLDVNGQTIRGQNEIRIREPVLDNSIKSIIDVLNRMLGTVADEISIELQTANIDGAQ